ncbi:MAG: hypothetical protein K2M03_04355 [Muribaculaceae bacterium]|nr:hypothetical protein [Muribaculaceae bacterium]MDE6295278.1 hypothetical protein [Muribaculaceae bacterium]
MTQIVVTLDNNADENLLRRMIENMKGVVKTTLTHSSVKVEKKAGTSEFMDSLHAIKKAIDPSAVDMSDSRTNYIMSK